MKNKLAIEIFKPALGFDFENLEKILKRYNPIENIKQKHKKDSTEKFKHWLSR